MQATSPPDTTDLVGRLELAIRMVGKRVYLPSLRSGGAVDRTSFPLLSCLAERHPEQVRPSEIAATLELDVSTVSRQLRSLEVAGLVERAPDPLDGRAARIGLSAAGRDALAAAGRTRSALLDTALADWDDADRADLLRLVERLLTDLAATAPVTLETR